MNTKVFVADIVLLIAFILQGMETHNSGTSFVDILIPYAIAITVIIPGVYKIGFIQINEETEHVKSLRVWMAVIIIGSMIRFIMNGNFAITYLIVIAGYSLITSGVIRLFHSKL